MRHEGGYHKTSVPFFVLAEIEHFRASAAASLTHFCQSSRNIRSKVCGLIRMPRSCRWKGWSDGFERSTMTNAGLQWLRET